LARALVSEPQILLLDEPLSNLDSKLRDYMRVELKELQRRIGVTTIYVTHDHAEAFALSQRIIVMHSGRVVATGSPRQLFENPQNRFLAEFLGHGNILEARLIQRRTGLAVVDTRIGQLNLKIPSDLKPNQEFHVCLRGRMLRAHRTRPRTADNLLKGVLSSIVYRGRDMLDYLVTVNDFTVSVHGKSVSQAGLDEGKPVYLEIPAQACTVIP
jgi:iron(III) transport system ATP-binding protein